MVLINKVDMDELRAQLRAVQFDANRYRWLLNQLSHQQCGPNVGWTLDRLLPGDDPESAIAAAMAKDLGA